MSVCLTESSWNLILKCVYTFMFRLKSGKNNGLCMDTYTRFPARQLLIGPKNVRNQRCKKWHMCFTQYTSLGFTDTLAMSSHWMLRSANSMCIFPNLFSLSYIEKYTTVYLSFRNDVQILNMSPPKFCLVFLCLSVFVCIRLAFHSLFLTVY